MPARLGKLKAFSLADRLGRRTPVFYDRAFETFHRLSSSTLEERRHFTHRRLRPVLRAAAKTPYGRPHAGKDVDDWPLLDKEPLRADPAAFVRARVPTISASTSGTTGVPLALTRTLSSVSAEQAAIDYLLTRVSVDPRRARIAVLRADTVEGRRDRENLWNDENAGRRRVFSSRDLKAETVGRFLEGLEEFEPDCLFAYPSSLEVLCALLAGQSASIRIPAVLTSSEVLPPATRRLAEDALGSRIVDMYGQAERVALAYALSNGEFWFLPGYGHVELLPVEQADDFHLHEVVATSLWNRAMPLVRYRTGDLIAVPSEADSTYLDEVRFGVRPFHRVFGRVSDYLLAPDGARIIGMNHIPRGVMNMTRMQIVQESPRLVRILVLAKDDFGPNDVEAIERNLRAKLPSGMTYRIEVVEQLERDAAAKTPFLIRRPDAEAVHAGADGSGRGGAA